MKVKAQKGILFDILAPVTLHTYNFSYDPAMKMSSRGPAALSPDRRSSSAVTGGPASTQSGGTWTGEWTEENEAELTELKAKLKAAHKSWSAEQELYHDRVRTPAAEP